MALNSNALYAKRYYMEKYNLLPHQADGIVGNIMQESAFNTGARNPGDGSDGSDSVGLAQWNGQRARNLKAFGGDNWNTLDTQLDFIMHELNGKGGNGGGSEAAAYRALMDSKDVGGATAAFIGYERPQGWKADNPTAGHGYSNRLRYAGLSAGMSPEEIANAQATSAPLRDDTRAVASAADKPDDRGFGTKLYDRLFGTETAEQAKASILPKMLPDEFMGVNTKKGINMLGALSGAMDGGANEMNQQAQATAQAARARVGQSEPTQITLLSSHKGAPGAAQAAPNGLSSIPNIGMKELEEIWKKQMAARKGLGGFGGLSV